MQKAIFSRIDLNNADNDLAQEYLSCIRDLLHLHDVQDLKAFTQHMNTSRFQHSLNVSYYTFLIARRFHLDSCSAARAGLLHDLYHYDWRNLDKEERPIEGRHCAVHPQIALENARKATFVNTIIEDAIVHHMWPMTLRCPKTKEGWVLQAVDKYCAISEILLQVGRRVRYSRLAISLAALLSFSIR